MAAIRIKPPTLKRERSVVQTFPEVCRYSCSHNGEARNFELARKGVRFSWGPLSRRMFESVEIRCQKCGWHSSIPANFARKVFKHGLRANLLIKYAKSKIITSRFLNFWGSLWRIWLVTLGVFFALVAYDYYSEPVLVGEPKQVAYQDLYARENLGKIVKVDGIVDYTLALREQIFAGNSNSRVISTEVYMPIFEDASGLDFVLIHGGGDDYSRVLTRSGVANIELLKDQEYSVIGRLESVDSLTNQELRDYYLTDLPTSKGYTPPRLIINSADVIGIKTFAFSYLLYFGLISVGLASSLAIQLFIDKKLVYKS